MAASGDPPMFVSREEAMTTTAKKQLHIASCEGDDKDKRGNSDGEMVGNNNDKAYENKDPRNPYSAVLAQQVAGSKASNLPKAHLVSQNGAITHHMLFK